MDSARRRLLLLVVTLCFWGPRSCRRPLLAHRPLLATAQDLGIARARPVPRTGALRRAFLSPRTARLGLRCLRVLCYGFLRGSLTHGTATPAALATGAPRTRGANGLFMSLLGRATRLLVLLRLLLYLVWQARGNTALGLLSAHRATATTPATLLLPARVLLPLLRCGLACVIAIGCGYRVIGLGYGRLLFTGNCEFLRLWTPIRTRIAACAALAARGSLKLGYCLLVGLLRRIGGYSLLLCGLLALALQLHKRRGTLDPRRLQTLRK